MAALGLHESLPSLVRTKYTSAKTVAGALTFAATELAVVDAYGLPFQIRYCPALAKKPTPKTESNNNSIGASTSASASANRERSKKPFDPFDNPDPSLLITHVPASERSSHLLVLNKYPIIPNHFILATRKNKPQTSLLEEDDLWLTYECLREWKTPSQSTRDAQNSDGLFAFFNSGRHSGASQPHRHVQLLPVEDMKHGLGGSEAWTLLVDALWSTLRKFKPGEIVDLSSHVSLPFRIFGAPLPPSSPAKPDTLFSSEFLHKIYTQLYWAAESAVHTHLEQQPNDFELDDTYEATGSLPISFNMAMTTSAMLLCPRRSEGRVVRREPGMGRSLAGKEGEIIDTVALNGTILGGTMMVKNEEVWEVLKKDGEELRRVLQEVGLPPLVRERAEEKGMGVGNL